MYLQLKTNYIRSIYILHRNVFYFSKNDFEKHHII